MDLNHDKQIQSLLCYRYTIGQCEAGTKVSRFDTASSRRSTYGCVGTPLSLAPGFSRVSETRHRSSRFSGFAFGKTAEAVGSPDCAADTRLKPGANDMAASLLGLRISDFGFHRHA